MNNTLLKFFQKYDQPILHCSLLLVIIIITCSYTYKNTRITNDPVIRKLEYDQTSITSFAVSNEVNVEGMHPFDIVNTHSESQVTHSEIQISNSGKIAFTNSYEPKIPQIEHGYRVPAKTVSDEHGTTLFNESGEAYYYSANNNETPFPRFDGNNDELLNFGYIKPLVNLTPEDIRNINASGKMVIIQNDHSYIIKDNASKITIDILNQTILTEAFVNDKMTTSTFEKFALVDADKAIKMYTIEKTYSTLLNGGLLEKTVRSQYDNYVINDIPIVVHEVQSNLSSKIDQYSHQSAYKFEQSFEEQSLLYNELLEVFPNPTYDMLNIVIHDSKPSEINQYTILNLDGKVMFTGRFDKTEAINISTLAPGVYRIVVVNSKQTCYSSFSRI